MINHNKWISSLPKVNKEISKTINQLDHENSINSIPKKDSYNSVKKYTLLTVLFICGLAFVSIVKNETRNLQKEINNLETSIDNVKFNLSQANLDNEVITSPENISLLAKKYLHSSLVPYEMSQIKSLNDKNEIFFEVKKTKDKKVSRKKIKNLPTDIKEQLDQKIKQTKTEIRKLQELYNDPKSIPEEIKTRVAKQIKEKKIELENIYNKPKSIFTFERVGKWTIIQVVKLFLGIPVVPGR